MDSKKNLESVLTLLEALEALSTLAEACCPEEKKQDAEETSESTIDKLFGYTFSDYQHDAARTINPKLDTEHATYHALLCLPSEVGEITDIFQKQLQGHSVDVDHLRKEMGDVLWAMAELATIMDLSLEDIAKENIMKLKARYPKGFEAERSINRKKGDI